MKTMRDVTGVLRAGYYGVPILESRFCLRGRVMEDVGTRTLIVPVLGVYQLEHGGRLPFECRYSRGMRELDRERRRRER